MTPPDAWTQTPTMQTPTIQGQFVRLEALSTAHAPDIARHADAATVAWLSRGGPAHNTPEEWAAHIGRLNALPNRANFAVLLGDQVAGRISYSEVRPSDLWLEIGTMLTPPFFGTAANPGAKLLLLTRAFEVLGAGRAHFKVDERNERSLRAMTKLGAVREGTLRHYQVRPDGFARNSVMFSVLRGEWPEVRARLIQQLNAVTDRAVN